MIKYFCDSCNKELVCDGDLKNPKYFTLGGFKVEINTLKRSRPGDHVQGLYPACLCTDCAKEIINEGAYCSRDYREK